MKNIFRKGLATLCLAIISSCEPTVYPSYEKDDIALKVSQSKNYFWGGVRYNGMIDDNRFVLSGLMHNSVPNFYPIDSKEVILDGNILDINFVSPDSINLTYLREKNRFRKKR